METPGERWKAVFMNVVQQHENALPLREASLNGNLKKWTTELTYIVSSSCRALSWEVAALGHKMEKLPVSREEYLSLDITAFEKKWEHESGGKRWPFPMAVFELENSRADEKIAYSLWKVLCVRADLRVVFCYRKEAEKAPALIKYLRDEVINSMSIEERDELKGETLIVIGSRNNSETFPYGFFKWWSLNQKTGRFELK